MPAKKNTEATLRRALHEVKTACTAEEAIIAASNPETKKVTSPKYSVAPKVLTVAQLKKVVVSVPKDRRLLAQNVAEELSFMSEMLAALKQKAREIGALENFVQGKQSLLRENPALKSYNTTIKNYAVLLSKLTDLLPKANAAPDEPGGDEFDDFVAGRNTD